MDTKKRADKLYRQGLLILYQPGKDSLKLLTEFWNEAINLYRQIGEEEKAVEVEKNLVRMHRRLNTATPLETEIIDDTGEQSKEDQNIKDFNDWNSFFKIGCFGFGGPMAVFGMLQDEFVVRKKILTNNDFLEGAVLGDILPGPVTMDIVTYTGYKLNKWSGALKATLLFILPSFVMMLIFAIYYDRLVIIPQIDSIFKCLGAAVAGLILSVGMRLGQQEVRDYYAVGIFLWAFISSFIFKFDILWVVLLSGIAGMLLFFKSYTAHSTNEEILQPGITKE